MRLRCTAGPLQGQTFDFKDGQSAVFGRDDSCALVLPSTTVSRKHGEIIVSAGQLQIKDLGSSNGIRVNRLRVKDAFLKARDVVQVGEFTFVVELNEPSEATPISRTKKADEVKPESTEKKQGLIAALPLDEIKEKLPIAKFRQAYDRFEKLDFNIKTLILVVLVGFLGHLFVSSPLVSEARTHLMKMSFEIARKAVRSLGDRNKRELAEGSNFLLDCEFLKQSSGVLQAILVDARGKVVCPIGKELPQDDLFESALFRGEAVDNCQSKVIEQGASDCDFVFPIREWRDQQGQYITVGAARITFSPEAAFEAVKSLQSSALRTMFLILGLMLVIWAVVRLWISRGVETVVEGVRLAVSGNVQSVENPESFAAFDSMVQEINRLISKSNQGFGSNSNGAIAEASFLQPLLQQVLLLEERPVMFVSRDNHFLASSQVLGDIIPVDLSLGNAHVTEVIRDSHLQTEIMGFLNDLSQANEVLDRALSLNDRVVQVRGMPIFVNNEYAAAFLIF